jgi:hypothetical protein
MGRASIAIRGADCGPGVLDGSISRQSFCDEKPIAGFCVGLGRTGQALSNTAQALASSYSDDVPEGPQEEVVLQLLWFRLSCEDRARFGGCFSRMVLKAFEQRTSHAGGSKP